MPLEFGVFDHLDTGDFPLGTLYANRLRLVEAYEVAGFYAYHLAEHHATTLGMAPSPGIFLSAVAQRTSRLRLGPMVYVLPLHDPLRLIEEICMLDQLSGGRLELGMGRGFSPFELAYFGVGHLESRGMYAEAREIILSGLAGKRLNFAGRYYHYIDVPMVLEPVQKPHPPLWYGLASGDGAAWAARDRINVVVNGAAHYVKPLLERYRNEHAKAHGDAALPMMALARHIYVAATEDAAHATGKVAYERWYRANAELWRAFGTEAFYFPSSYEEALKLGTLIVGTPDQVIARLESDLRAAGANYLMGRFTFGNMPLDRALENVSLFAREVVPALQALLTSG
jgi:alkanesulfonate monooxygenase SsuD/methylene tetrahydromethanopterin reductase-like flavin-dependent oxidoreductase (luciferase family)